MPVSANDIVYIDITNEMLTTARYLAKYRDFYEYPRDIEHYNYGAHIDYLINGYLGELAFFKYVHDKLFLLYGAMQGRRDRYDALAAHRFSHNMVLGTVDGGFDFKKGLKTIDVKGAVGKYYRSCLLDRHLLVDQDQVDGKITADIYVATFVCHKFVNEQGALVYGDSIAIAGYCFGVPPIGPTKILTDGKKIPRPAYISKVTDLQPMSSIFTELGFDFTGQQ